MMGKRDRGEEQTLETVQSSERTLPHEHTESAPASPQLVPDIHTQSGSSRSINCPLTSQSVTPLCCSWFRPAVAALAASGARPPHFNASDIYLGRTTGGTGGGGRPHTAPVDVDSLAVNFPHSTPTPPPSIHSLLSAVFLLRGSCVPDYVSSISERYDAAAAARFKDVSWSSMTI